MNCWLKIKNSNNNLNKKMKNVNKKKVKFKANKELFFLLNNKMSNQLSN